MKSNAALTSRDDVPHILTGMDPDFADPCVAETPLNLTLVFLN